MLSLDSLLDRKVVSSGILLNLRSSDLYGLSWIGDIEDSHGICSKSRQLIVPYTGLIAIEPQGILMSDVGHRVR